MGGNAIKNSERFSKEEKPFIESVLKVALAWCGAKDKYKFIESYRNKPDHGDMDILIHNSVDRESFICSLKHHCGEDFEVVRNSNVFSVGYPILSSNHPDLPPNQKKIIQVDFIFLEDLESAYNYFSYNDLGNLIGRLAHKMGFSLGQDGLKYIFREGDQVYHKEVVSTDWKKILEFLGLDWITWKEGFDELEDIFSWVAESPFFNPDIYLLHNRNNVSRTRDRKRKTYMEFLKWCEGMETNKVSFFPWATEDEEKDNQKSRFLSASFSHFEQDGWSDKFSIVLYNLRQDRRFRQWWNGDIAREITGLEGKELGMFMQDMGRVFDLRRSFEEGMDSRAMCELLWEGFK